jgi:hypothetical protein
MASPGLPSFWHMITRRPLRISFLHHGSQHLLPYARPGSDDPVLAQLWPSVRLLFQHWLYFHLQHLPFLILPVIHHWQANLRHLGSLIQDHTTMLRQYFVMPYPSPLASHRVFNNTSGHLLALFTSIFSLLCRPPIYCHTQHQHLCPPLNYTDMD